MAFTVENFQTILACYAFILIAEMGDKSQLVCLALTQRYRKLYIFVGASLAFIFLNTLAVLFGHLIAQAIPPFLLAMILTALFLGFGLHALLGDDEEKVTLQAKKTQQWLLAILSTFSLIFFAELGDKTQLSIIALASSQDSFAVWLGSSLALLTTTMLGLLIGEQLIKRLPKGSFNKISALIFFIFATVAAYKSYLYGLN